MCQTCHASFPADTILTADATQVANQAAKAGEAKGLPQSGPLFVYSFTGGEVYWNPKPNFRSPNIANFANAQLIYDPKLDQDNVNTAVGHMRHRHNDGVNASYADGHTKYIKKEAHRLQNWHPDFHP